jgi:hypothetical protein
MKKSILITAIIVAMSIISCVSTGGGKETVVTLHAIDARLETNASLVYEEQEGRECIGWWESPDDRIIWDFNVDRDGKYLVILRAACASSFAGSKIGVTIGEDTLEFVMPDTYEWETYFDVEIGTVALKAGAHTIVVQGIELQNRFFGNLQLVTLKKAG